MVNLPEESYKIEQENGIFKGKFKREQDIEVFNKLLQDATFEVAQYE